MSEIKQEILDLLILNGRKPQSIKSGDRVVYLYDALNIVNKEFSKTEQPQLNENQQIVLDHLKVEFPSAKPMQVIFWMMNNAAWGKLDDIRKPIMHLTDKQQAQVLVAFGQWAQKQEEE